MIGPVSVKVSASHPNFPLRAVPVFQGSACSIGVECVPAYFGGVSVTGVSVSVETPDGETSTASAKRSGCMWVATFGAEAFTVPGSVRNGLTVTAHGIEEDGETPASWTLGKGDLDVISADGVPVPGEVWQNVHLRDSVPSAPAKGDLAKVGSVWKIYTGSAWESFGGGSGGSVVESATNPGYAANADTAGVALRASHADTAENATRAQEADAAISSMSATNAGYADSAPWSGITGKPGEFAPSSHASSHAANGVDEIKPSDIGALPISYNEDDDQTEVNVSTRGGERTIMRISSNTDGHSLLYLGTKPYELGELFVGVTGGGLLRVGHTDSDFAEIQVAGVGDDAKVRIYKDEDDGRGHVKVNGSEVATEGQVTDAETRLNARIDLIEATSRPNMNIVGSPKFNQGVVSGFSANDYLMFQTQVDVGQNAVEFYMSFTTGADVTTQQNILDSWCGLAIAIRNGRFILAASQNGTEFVTGESGPSSVAPNTSYSIAVLFSHPSENVYVVRLSEEVQMVDLCSVELSAPLFATATYWGGANPQSGVNHIFGGTINLNECRMVWNGVEVWRGYDELPTVKFDPTAEPRLDTAEKIAALSAYPMAAVVGGELKDRTVNHATAGGTFTFPARTATNARDFVLVVDALATAPSVTFPSGVNYVSDQAASDVWTAEANKVNAWYFSEVKDGVFMVSHKTMDTVAQ